MKEYCLVTPKKYQFLEKMIIFLLERRIANFAALTS
jgi:predicted protein tyrosine phosphatase